MSVMCGWVEFFKAAGGAVFVATLGYAIVKMTIGLFDRR